jgi:hypothetical protein
VCFEKYKQMCVFKQNDVNCESSRDVMFWPWDFCHDQQALMIDEINIFICLCLGLVLKYFFCADGARVGIALSQFRKCIPLALEFHILKRSRPAIK